MRVFGYLLSPVLLIVVFWLSGCSSKSGQSIRLITYNIRFDTPDDGLNAWPYRKGRVAHMTRFYNVDLLCVQEALNHQLLDIMQLVDGYQLVGVGRDDGHKEGEFSAIVYRTKRFEVLSSGTFWLSETPDTPSLGWDAACKRVCTWAIFNDKFNRKRFAVFNTHFDHVGREARKKSAQLLLNRIELLAAGLPVVITGDLNMTPSDSSIALIASAYADTYHAARIEHYGPAGTWNGFDYNSMLDIRIDYCFADSNMFDVVRHAHIDDAFAQRFPSDHLPVFVELCFR